MHWVAFIIVLFITTTLQAAVAPFLAVHTIRPDFLAVLAVHYALLARNQDALIACWVIGLAIDLASLSYSQQANVGAAALAMGLIGMAIVKVRDLTFRENVMPQIVFTFAATFFLTVWLGLFASRATVAGIPKWDIVVRAFYTALYTALLSPYGHWILRRCRGLLGIGAASRLRVG